MCLKYFLVFTLLFFSCSVFSMDDKGSLSGIIKDSSNLQPLSGATVSLPDLKVSTVADANGNYRFANIPNGRVTILISYVGYKSKAMEIMINGATIQNFSLLPSAVENDNVTVTGVSSATQLKRTPVQVSVISKKDLQQSTGTTLLDAVAKEPGVSIVTTGPAIAKPFIRGLGYNRVVTINDGMRQEGQQWGDEHGVEIDEYSAQKIEVLRGPASLMYGSDAIGGVINILTNVPVSNNTMQANISGSLNGNNNMQGGYANFAGNVNGFNWNAYASVKNAGDYNNKYDGDVLNSRFNEKNFGGYFGINKSWGFTHLIFSDFNQKLGIVEGERSDDGDLVLDGYTMTDELKSSRKPLIPYQGIHHTKVALDNSFSLNNAGRVTALVGFQHNQRKEFGEIDEPTVPEAYFDLKTINYNVAYHFTTNSGWKTSFGGSGMSQQNENKAEEALIPAYNLFDFGLYGVTAKTFDNTTLSGGLRYDTRTMHGKSLTDEEVERFIAFDKKFSNISASIGATHNFNDHVTLKANVSRGFRAPNASELAANGEHEGTNRYEIGNHDLKSEIATAADLGLEVTTNHIDFDIAPYFNHISNYIFYNKLVGANGVDSLIDEMPAYKFNQQDAMLAGIEARLDIHPHPLDWLHFENTFSFVRGKFSDAVDGSYNLPLIAPASLITELRGEFPSVLNIFSNLYAKFEVNTVSSQKNYFSGYATETATDGYILLNAGFGSDVKIKGRKLCTFSIALNNITDRAYQSHLSRLKYTDENVTTGRIGVFNMGRNFTARLTVPFEWKLK